MLQYRKRYELLQHAVPNRGKYTHPSTLQYRKRYELLQLNNKGVYEVYFHTRYNTASGMSCCNLPNLSLIRNAYSCYNTASGMSCCN